MTLYEFAVAHTGRVITVQHNLGKLLTMEGIELVSFLEGTLQYPKFLKGMNVINFENTESGIVVHVGNVYD